MKEKILKKKPAFHLPHIPSITGMIRSLMPSRQAKGSISSQTAQAIGSQKSPIDMVGKSPAYPEGQMHPQPTTSVPPQQSADPQRTPQKQQPEEKILGNEMREIYGETGPTEQPKESFADIKKKVNNIFDD